MDSAEIPAEINLYPKNSSSIINNSLTAKKDNPGQSSSKNLQDSPDKTELDETETEQNCL